MKLPLITLAAGAGILAGMATSFAAAPTVTITPAVVNEYMFRGVRLGGASFQPSAEVGVGGLTVGLWVNVPLADRVPGQSDPEFDPYVSYTFQLTEALSITPGFTAYVFPNADEAAGLFKETYEPYLEIGYTLRGVEIKPKVYYDLVLEGPTFEVNLAYAIPLKSLRTELDFSAMAGAYVWANNVRDADPKIENRGVYYQVGVALPFEVTRHVTFTVGVAYTEGLENYLTPEGGPRVRNDAAVSRVVGTASLAFTF